MTLSIAVVCEGPADPRTGCGLADRLICERVDWIERGQLPNFRTWRGLEPGEDYLKWTAVKRLADQRGIRVHGHYSGEPAAPDAHAATKALRLLWETGEPPDAVVLLRDTDGDEDRARGLAQARDHWSHRRRVVIGLADPKQECWVLAGFQPKDEQELLRLSQIVEELGFDPTEKPESLTSRKDDNPRSAKRVFAVLLGTSLDRQCACWEETDIETLRRRGQSTGLPEYLDEVEERLLPLLGHQPARK